MGSICLLLHDNRQLNQHHLLKMLSFFQLNGFTAFLKDQVTIGVWFYFWVFYLILSINLSGFMPISCRFFLLL